VFFGMDRALVHNYSICALIGAFIFIILNKISNIDATISVNDFSPYQCSVCDEESSLSLPSNGHDVLTCQFCNGAILRAVCA
jgi:hypothetical protein